MKSKAKGRLVWKEKDHLVNRQKEERYNLKCFFSIMNTTLNPTNQNVSRKFITTTFHRRGTKLLKETALPTQCNMGGEVLLFCFHISFIRKLKDTYRELSVDLHGYDDTIIMKWKNCDSNQKQKRIKK